MGGRSQFSWFRICELRPIVDSIKQVSRRYRHERGIYSREEYRTIAINESYASRNGID